MQLTETLPMDYDGVTKKDNNQAKKMDGKQAAIHGCWQINPDQSLGLVSLAFYRFISSE